MLPPQHGVQTPRSRILRGLVRTGDTRERPVQVPGLDRPAGACGEEAAGPPHLSQTGLPNVPVPSPARIQNLSQIPAPLNAELLQISLPHRFLYLIKAPGCAPLRRARFPALAAPALLPSARSALPPPTRARSG